jgi:hypothetical protein
MLRRPVLFRQRALIGAGIAFAVAMLLWNIPQLDFIVYPVRLFVTFVHESGHGLAALFSGGHFERLDVFANGSGLALTAGGSRALILMGGYLGAALFGAALFYAANTIPHSRVISLILGVVIVAITLFYTTFISTAFFVGLAMGVGLFVLGSRAHDDINLILLNVLAMLTGLNAVLDLVFLVGNTSASIGAVRNDAAQFSVEFAPFVPAAVWAALWAGLAILMLGAAVWFSVIRPRRVL